MKTIDIHQDISDSVLLFGHDIYTKTNIADGEFPCQSDIFKIQSSNLDVFAAIMCPLVRDDNGGFQIPKDVKNEIRKHHNVYKDLEDGGHINIIREKNDLETNGLKAVLGLEGVYFIEEKSDFEFLKKLISKGLKQVGPYWNFSNALFVDGNVTDLGSEFLSVCEEHNIIIDVAHSEGKILKKIVETYEGSVLDSHTNMNSVFAHPRNISDSEVSAILDKGGLVGLSFVGTFIGGNSIEDYCRHVKYFIKKFGDKNLAIGSDFNGMRQKDKIQGVEDITKYEFLFQKMDSLGISEKSLENIFYNNAFHFYKSSFELRGNV